ncbi:MAG TPA: histidine kinase dimerization/phospho-acceptor domain-containing protein, partial [Ilumatobacteraceae bacterium]|nr:histidine kinase dimerization/phospho-acceptor domain-containing protein [Ilumatobacteraceae bacterium]
MVGPSRLKRALSLRTRFTLYLALTALATSTLLTAFAFTRARTYLLDQRGAVTRQQAYANANSLLFELRNGDPSTIGTFFLGLRTDESGFAYLYRDGQQRAFLRPGRPESLLPEGFAAKIRMGQSGQQRFSVDGATYVAVGVNINSAGAQYIEVFPLANTESVIRQIGTALLIGAIVITVLAGGLGWWISRRLLKPVSRVAAAAGGIASGALDTRLQPESDPELNRLAQSFNDMADTVQTRIEREAQFASDVSHELRSPITALSAAVEVLDARRDDLPERTRQALTVVVDQVRRFDQMVLDLLELSRLDAGVTDLNLEEL